MTSWEIQADQRVKQNRANDRPCLLNALKANGNCKAFTFYKIKEGHFGAVKFDGLNVLDAFGWPKPIDAGKGKAFLIIDERADDEQRAALLSIISHNDAEPGIAICNVFAATLDEPCDPELKPDETETDVDGFECSVARMAGPSRTMKTPVPLEFRDAHGRFAHIHLCNAGIFSA